MTAIDERRELEQGNKDKWVTETMQSLVMEAFSLDSHSG